MLFWGSACSCFLVKHRVRTVWIKPWGFWHFSFSVFFFFFKFLLLFWPQCFLEKAQMIWWCCSGICRALALLALLFPLQERSCWGLNPSSGDLEKSPHSDPDPWDVPHRNRRSWVWNQFFVLEEYTGNEPLYVGKVSDPLAQFSVLYMCKKCDWAAVQISTYLCFLFIYHFFARLLHLHNNTHINNSLPQWPAKSGTQQGFRELYIFLLSYIKCWTNENTKCRQCGRTFCILLRQGWSMCLWKHAVLVWRSTR